MSDSNRFTHLGDGVYRHYNTWQIKNSSKGKYDMALENALWDKTGIDPRASRTERMPFVTLDVNGDSIKRASMILSGIENGAYRAIGSTMKRAAEHGRTIGMRQMANRYTAGANTLKRYLKTRGMIEHESKHSYSIEFGYEGFHVPLMEFDTRIGKDGRVETRVLRNTARKTLDHAFIGGTTGKIAPTVYERIGTRRYPIRRLYGPAATQAFSDDDTQQAVGDAITDNFNKRIDHEIWRVLNGLGGR